MRVETMAEQLFFTTVYVKARSADGSEWTGTAFIHAVETNIGTAHFLVTNKHMLESADHLNVRLVSRESDDTPKLGKVVRFEVSHAEAPGLWVGHPSADVDVAVLPVGAIFAGMQLAGAAPYFRAIGTDLLPDEAALAELDALQQVTFVGYPNGLYDKANFLPIARLGHTATPPDVDYNGWPAFLIDASVFPGSSGSPVFLLDRGFFPSRMGGVEVGSRLALLGVVAAVHIRQDTHEVVPLPAKLGAVVSEALDLGIVFKARAISETVDEMLSQHELTRVDAPPSAPPGETTKADAEIAGDLTAGDASPSA